MASVCILNNFNLRMHQKSLRESKVQKKFKGQGPHPPSICAYYRHAVFMHPPFPHTFSSTFINKAW